MNHISSDGAHRFAPITDENVSGQLWIVSILCLIYCALVLIVRLHIKWNLYGADDVAVTLATFLQLGGVIPLFIAMKNGLGGPMDLLNDVQIETIGKATFAAQLFQILSLATAKISVAALMLRLFTRDIQVTRKSWIICQATILLTVLWTIGSIIATSFQCSPSNFLRQGVANQCQERLSRWRIITAFDIFIEVLLVLLPVAFIWPIQLKRYIKLQVAVAFGFRLPVIAFAAVHLHFVSKYSSSTNVSRTIIPALIYQQYELSWSLLSATIPTLKSFMRSFNSGFGMEIDMDAHSGYKSGTFHNGAYPLGSMQRSTARVITTTSIPDNREYHEGVKRRGSPHVQNRPARSVRSARTVGVSGPKDPEITSFPAEPREGRSGSITSDGSQDMIIKREVAWSVSYEESAATTGK
ncbi:hypothetical protein IQ07DRAFT_628764 [Pyrenochaeta sp. DS3sAY3a]|nr:hypothetical protein IQ07DRAFT_628764 [Pyrenochaeta sp. DS3sAY3a]